MGSGAVLLFSKLNKLFLGYVDPENIFYIIRINIFWGGLIDVSVKKEALFRGTGLDDEGWQKKCEVVASTVARGLQVLSEVESGAIVSEDGDSSEARKAEVLLREIGGLEIASMTGAMLQGAEVRPLLYLQCCFQNKY